MTSIQHSAPVSDPRRDTAQFAYAPPANHWLRMIYAALVKIRCLLTCVDGVETATGQEADAAPVEALAAHPRSKKVIVVNESEVACLVYEGGALVAVVAPGKTQELPMPGLLAITIASASEFAPTAVTVTRYLRCKCGDEDVVYTSEPVGAFLL